jgi:predicted lipoprotein with Yx(FWY)xxD motif
MALIAILAAGVGVAIYLAVDASHGSATAGELQLLRGEVRALRGHASQLSRLNGRFSDSQRLAHSSELELASLQAQVKGLRRSLAADPSVAAGPAHGVTVVPSAAGSSAEAHSTSQSPTASATGSVVSAASSPKLGKIIVDSRGLTLYDFRKDEGGKSACYGSCAGVWPPLLTKGAPQAGGGATASQLGTDKRKDGTVQVTYAGHPLYTYVGDKKPGDTAGNAITEFGASWHALRQSGAEAPGS